MRLLKQKDKRRMKKKCSLCKKMEARTLCESDEASLCWKCDWKVHGANFLVARHIRYLLCAVCHSPTPWSASGPFLSHSLALCHSCSSVNAHHQEGENQKERGRSRLMRRSERSEADKRVELCLSCGTVAKRFHRSCDREEFEGLDVDSSENVSRTT